MLTLTHGDPVALIAPASGQRCGNELLVEKAINTLTEWGLNVVQTPLLSSHRYLASQDQYRAQSLISAITNPEIKAIFMTRGGYGCARLLPYLKNINAPSSRLLVGFSDICSLHLHFHNDSNIHRVHAPNLATEQFLGFHDEQLQNRQSLYEFLFSEKLPCFSLEPLFEQGHIDNIDLTLPMTGGCLSLILSSLGTEYEIDTKDRILMIEDVGESPYKIDRMLTQLHHAKKFESAHAIIIGDLVGCHSNNIDCYDVVREILNDINCPVYHSPKFGHGSYNMPWLYGQ